MRQKNDDPNRARDVIALLLMMAMAATASIKQAYAGVMTTFRTTLTSSVLVRSSSSRSFFWSRCGAVFPTRPSPS